MEKIKKYLLERGFIIKDKDTKNSFNLEFNYSKTIDGFAFYNVNIKSHTNWFFTMEIEKISLTNSVVGFPKQTYFKGVISSKNTIQILEIILTATGINNIIENH